MFESFFNLGQLEWKLLFKNRFELLQNQPTFWIFSQVRHTHRFGCTKSPETSFAYVRSSWPFGFGMGPTRIIAAFKKMLLRNNISSVYVFIKLFLCDLVILETWVPFCSTWWAWARDSDKADNFQMLPYKKPRVTLQTYTYMNIFLKIYL